VTRDGRLVARAASGEALRIRMEARLAAGRTYVRDHDPADLSAELHRRFAAGDPAASLTWWDLPPAGAYDGMAEHERRAEAAFFAWALAQGYLRPLDPGPKRMIDGRLWGSVRANESSVAFRLTRTGIAVVAAARQLLDGADW
jgi:hypothetical protein